MNLFKGTYAYTNGPTYTLVLMTTSLNGRGSPRVFIFSNKNFPEHLLKESLVLRCL